VNIDQFIRTHEPAWRKLEALSRRVRRTPKGTTRAERSEFLHLYQLTSAHLSQLRSGSTEPHLDARLTRLLADSSDALYGQRQKGAKGFLDFFRVSFPAALWHLRRYIYVSAALFFLPAILMALYVANVEEATAGIPPAVAETYINEDFESYYSSEAAAEFATTVFINNIWVSFMAFALGIVLCVGSAFVLVNNGVMLGQAAGLFAEAGQLDKFFGLILPHGMLELTAIVIAGGTGLVLGWTIIAPGDRTRADALAEEGRRVIVVVLGLVLVFFAAALIEGFVTGAPLSTLIRVGIGVASWLAFVLYAIVYGRRAAADGRTGLWGELRPGWEDQNDAELSTRAVVLSAFASSDELSH